MKKSLIYICILLTSISCQTETNTKEILESDPLKPDTITLAKKQQLASGECQFILNNEAIEFTWSAFKTTLREEVKGSSSDFSAFG